MSNQDGKDINLRQVYTDDDLESVILSRLGGNLPMARDNAMNRFAPLLDTISNIEARLQLHSKDGKTVSFKCLEHLKARLELQGNHEVISQLDPQSQAIIKTAIKPTIQEVD